MLYTLNLLIYIPYKQSILISCGYISKLNFYFYFFQWVTLIGPSQEKFVGQFLDEQDGTIKIKLKGA
jgi:hypothetical protein